MRASYAATTETKAGGCRTKPTASAPPALPARSEKAVEGAKGGRRRREALRRGSTEGEGVPETPDSTTKPSERVVRRGEETRETSGRPSTAAYAPLARAVGEGHVGSYAAPALFSRSAVRRAAGLGAISGAEKARPTGGA